MEEVPTRSQIHLGDTVYIETKKDQGTGRLTRGVVTEILTSSESHPHGIKVRLKGGQIGRIKKMDDDPSPDMAEFKDLEKIDIPKVESAMHEFKKYYHYDDNMARMAKGPDSKKAIEGLRYGAEQRVAEAVAGFANSTRGGFLYVGVDDGGSICGLDRDLQLGRFANYSDDFANHLNARLIEYLKDKVFISTKIQMVFREVEGQTICIMQILPAERPIHLHVDGEEIFPVRGPAPRSQRLTVTEQVEYIRKRFHGA